ncbi:hypothetical protein [Brachybacterium phenoliresistens]|nr:hypothetical protein [Brachybacterium phenoliresistens]
MACPRGDGEAGPGANAATAGRTTVGHTSDPGFWDGMGIGDGIGRL